MKNLKNDLFKKFEQNELKQLHFCTGGERTGTGAPGTDTTPCTLDTAELRFTPVAGAPEGYTEPDYSDYQDACGVGVEPVSGSGTGTGTLPPALPVLP